MRDDDVSACIAVLPGASGMNFRNIGSVFLGRGCELTLRCNHRDLAPLTRSLLAYIQMRWGSRTRDNDALLLQECIAGCYRHARQRCAAWGGVRWGVV